MSEEVARLTVGFDADLAGLDRGIDTAGRALDGLALRLARRSGDALGGLAGLAGGVLALRPAPSADPEADRSGTGAAGGTDPPSAVVSRLKDRLHLLQSVGKAHDDIALRMRTEAELARLGTEATAAQKLEVVGLVAVIARTTDVQRQQQTQERATALAGRFTAGQIETGVEGMIFDRRRAGDAAATLLRNMARQGLRAALIGGGPFAGLMGTEEHGGTGGLFGALSRLVPPLASGFAGLFAAGGTIGPGRWGVVGEAGPELVAGPAAVVPWNRPAPTAPAPAGRGASAPVIHLQVTTPDAPSFARSEGQIAALLARAVARGQRRL